MAADPRPAAERLRYWSLVLVAGLCLAGTGCFGVTGNPSYFPHLLPTGDIIRTHAKPPLWGYFSNFDPRACRLEVRPIEATNPVQTQHVLIATVYDKTGKPLRKRRVEWMLEGVGNIVEVDESGLFPGRGYKVDNRYAVSYTDYAEHRITRGNDDPSDDFVIRPGQTWCVITSALEGDTKVTVYAPEIYNWEHHKVFVTKHWVDAEWRLPPPAVNLVGTEHVFTTQIFRHTDKEPLANYRVRYRIIDGPPAVFLPHKTQEAVVVSDFGGNASVTMVQAVPQAGLNRVSVEIIRPPDPCAPSGSVGIVIGQGETTKEWQGPRIAIDKSVPPALPLGQEVPWTITVTNVGQVECQPLTVRDRIPEGLEFLRAEPPASRDGPELVWTLPGLPGGGRHVLQMVCRSTRPGPVTNCAVVTSLDGLRDEKCATTQITVPGLQVSKTGPATAVIGQPVPFQITVSNPGSGPATNVVLTDDFDPGLEHETRANPVRLELGTLAPGETKTVPITLIARQAGRQVNRVTAAADGNLTSQARHEVLVQVAQLKIDKVGPPKRYVGRPAEWNIRVVNPGEVPLTNVVVRDQLPPELSFISAGQNGAPGANPREVVWNLGTLQPGEERVLQVNTRCDQMTPSALNVAIATADPGLTVQAEAAVEILGLPAFRLEVDDTDDPVELGGQTSYQIVVTNQGSLPGNQVEIVAVIPPQMRLVNASGPAPHRIDGQRVVFGVVDSLPPGQQLSYNVAVQAVEVGDVRFRTELRSSTLRDPVIEEESTNIFQPIPGMPRPPGGGAAPVPGPTPGPGSTGRLSPVPAPGAPAAVGANTSPTGRLSPVPAPPAPAGNSGTPAVPPDLGVIPASLPPVPSSGATLAPPR